MSAPGEHKTVQARILAYAQEIGWRFVPLAEADHFRENVEPLGYKAFRVGVVREECAFYDVCCRLEPGCTAVVGLVIPTLSKASNLRSPGGIAVDNTSWVQ